MIISERVEEIIESGNLDKGIKEIIVDAIEKSLNGIKPTQEIIDVAIIIVISENPGIQGEELKELVRKEIREAFERSEDLRRLFNKFAITKQDLREILDSQGSGIGYLPQFLREKEQKEESS